MSEATSAESERARVVRVLEEHARRQGCPPGYAAGGINFTLNALRAAEEDVVNGVDYPTARVKS